MRQFIFALLISALFTACGSDSAATEKAAMEASYAAQQTAYDAMMDGHDRVMPLMGNINAAQKAIKARMEQEGEKAEGLDDLLKASFEELEDANDGMMEWMSGLKSLDDLRGSMDNDGIMAYIKEEAADIAKVEVAMKSALGNAQMVIGDPGHDHDHEDGHDHDHSH